MHMASHKSIVPRRYASLLCLRASNSLHESPRSFSFPALILMKRLLLFASIVIVIAPVLRAYWPFTPEQASDFLARLSAPLAMAKLYASEPDGQLSMPVKAVKVKQVHNTWHAARSGGRLHQGQDIFAPRGAEVYSATKGYVLRVGEDSLGGNTVAVLGAGGRVYYYAHLEAYAPDLSAGDTVTPGTLLGYVGTTGNARGTPPHLHFGVYTPSGPINPLPLLLDRAVDFRESRYSAGES